MFNNAMLSGFELYSRWVPLFLYQVGFQRKASI